MKAAYIEQFGGPEVLQYGDLPDPVAGAGPGRRRRRGGERQRRRLEGARGPLRAGEVSAGPGPGFFRRGRARWARASTTSRSVTRCSACSKPGREGAYAEKLAINAAIVAKKPDGLSHVDAAALALTGLTALISVENDAQAAARRDHPDPRRRRRRGELRHTARQAPRRPRDHHHQRGERRLCARPRRR